ncbi:hypothetical protein AAFF_G00356780 [Aldrovandia affinis]|uniref:Uncharacterized protein n=1 Tax=Aldrovandia affinis TaxID=143900 RepID=A0AAD7T8P0_9TELE|nr:hypothetical protein AAFF_G00356780 [Aldrovandia affinis]
MEEVEILTEDYTIYSIYIRHESHHNLFTPFRSCFQKGNKTLFLIIGILSTSRRTFSPKISTTRDEIWNGSCRSSRQNTDTLHALLSLLKPMAAACGLRSAESSLRSEPLY